MHEVGATTFVRWKLAPDGKMITLKDILEHKALIMKTFPDLIEKFDVIDTKADGCISKSELIASAREPPRPGAQGVEGLTRRRRSVDHIGIGSLFRLSQGMTCQEVVFP